jgi:hypothetical protein
MCEDEPLLAHLLIHAEVDVPFLSKAMKDYLQEVEWANLKAGIIHLTLLQGIAIEANKESKAGKSPTI